MYYLLEHYKYIVCHKVWGPPSGVHLYRTKCLEYFPEIAFGQSASHKWDCFHYDLNAPIVSFCVDT